MRYYLVVLLLLVSVLPARPSGQGVGSPPRYLDPEVPAEDRARDLVSRMTLEQKVGQMQHGAPGIPELNIPPYNWWNEALHGVARAGQATVFPQAIGLAATWDTDLLFRVADVISTEARAKYNDAIRRGNRAQFYGLTFWSPNINIFRDPRWGRGQETYGEDPFLTGTLAVAFIRGLQGDDARYYKTIATAKHFAVHSGPEATRHSANVRPSDRDLNDTYLPAFRMAVADGRVASVMCAYNRIDGVPACANTELLQKTLREAWGFDGYVVSDCRAISDFVGGHHYRELLPDAAAAALKGGTDLSCGTEFAALREAVRSGAVRETEIDRALERLFVARFRLGMFDPPDRVPFSRIPISENDSAAHRALALEAARKSIVLLKNTDQVLPLASSVRSIAVIGPSADDPESPLGNYNGFSSVQVTPLAGIESAFAGRADVRFAQGSPYVAGSYALIASQYVVAPGTDTRGVRAEYFDNANLQNSPRFTRVEPRPGIPNVRDSAPSEAGVPAQGYSVRWTGDLTAPVTGDYVFNPTGGSTGVRIYIDDTELLPEKPGPEGIPVPVIAKGIVAGRHYALRIDYRPAPGRGTNAVQVRWRLPVAPLLAEALTAVKDADVTLAFVGLNPRLEGEEMSVDAPGFKGGDRTDIALPAPQRALLDAAFSTGKPVIVVLTSGSAVAVDSAETRAAAVLAAWYGGEEIGNAIAETLTGVNNPAGRLPVTFYRDVRQLPAFDNYSMKGRTYRYFTGSPLYAFGFGLSYSTFRYEDLRVTRTEAGARVTARVTNTGERDGDEVAQLYVSGEGDDRAPVRTLGGFKRLHLGAGESADVEFVLDERALRGTGARTLVSVGGGQPLTGIAYVQGPLR